MSVDFGKTAKDYARHRQGFPPELFARAAAAGVGLSGQRLVDLGTGTGALARQFARRGCEVVGVDPAEPLLTAARELDAEAGVRVEYRVGTAESTGLPDASFDVVTAGQCWHWFDKAQASSEVARLLRPGGLLLITHMDWARAPGNVIDVTELLIEEFAGKDAWPSESNLSRGILYPRWIPDLQTAGFSIDQRFDFPTSLSYAHDAWRGRVRASAAVGAGRLSAEQVAEFDRRLAVELRGMPDPVAVPHHVWAMVGTLRGA